MERSGAARRPLRRCRVVDSSVGWPGPPTRPPHATMLDADGDPRDAETPSLACARRGNGLILGELTALVGLTVADAWGVVPRSRTPFLRLLCWVSLWLRRLSWRDIGFTR